MILAVEGDLSSYHHGGYSIASNRLMLGPLDEMVVTRLDDGRLNRAAQLSSKQMVRIDSKLPAGQSAHGRRD